MMFAQLMGKRVLGKALPADYGAWAETLLAQGSESINVAILAGLGLEKYPDSAELELYFRQTIKELGITPPNPRDTLKTYAHHLCEQILTGKIDIDQGVAELASLYPASDYDVIYSIWDELSEDLWMVNHDDSAIFNRHLTSHNLESFVQGIAAQFILLRGKQLPPDFWSLSVCPHCNYIGPYQWEAHRPKNMISSICQRLRGKSPHYRAICAHCGEANPYNMGDYEGRKLYFQIRPDETESP